MAKSSRTNMKQNLLFAFVGFCVFLVIMIWADGISGNVDGDSDPGYVRPTAAATIDDSFYENWNASETATPTPETR